MNLQGFVQGVIGAVSPNQPANLLLSTGPGPTQPDGTKQPTYAPIEFIQAQIQPLTTGDLRKLDSLNIQGVNNRIYITGELRGLQRINQLGGDLVILPDGTTYLVRAVLENWYMDLWCLVAATLQNDKLVPYVQRPRF
jgi:hypothetical protein